MLRQKDSWLSKSLKSDQRRQFALLKSQFETALPDLYLISKRLLLNPFLMGTPGTHFEGKKPMRFFKTLTFLIFIFSASSAWSGINLYVWNFDEGPGSFILPVRDQETPEKALQRYLKELEKSTDLMELFRGQIPLITGSQFEKLEIKNPEEFALLIANDPKDYTKKSERIFKFKSQLEPKRHTVFVLPIVASLGLSFTERAELFSKINTNFGLLIGLGGDDVEPSLYNQPSHHAKNTTRQRDEFEIQLLKSYFKYGVGFYFGVCRGSQIASVALGYQLIQDIPAQILEHNSHANDWHSIQLKPTKFNLLNAGQSLIHPTIEVNSLHHQSVRFTSNGPLELAALSQDGVVEATEFKNGRGLLVQFHPEFMDTAFSDSLFKSFITHKNRIILRSCSKIFSF